MSLGDIQVLDFGAFGPIGSRKFSVGANATGASIKAGELVLKALGSAVVAAWGTSVATKPAYGTDFLAGLAETTSTETTTATGTVTVLPIVPGVVYLGVPTAPTSWDTQAEYDALVGDRVLLDSSSAGVQTLLATDGTGNGLVIEPLEVAKYPGKVAFSLRTGLAYYN